MDNSYALHPNVLWVARTQVFDCDRIIWILIITVFGEHSSLSEELRQLILVHQLQDTLAIKYISILRRMQLVGEILTVLSLILLARVLSSIST